MTRRQAPRRPPWAQMSTETPIEALGGPDAPIDVRGRSGALKAVSDDCGPPADARSGKKLPDLWQLWFPARLGPPRTVRVRGINRRIRREELPPSQNGSRGNPFAHAAWVKVWRTAARDMARARRLPRLERARISIVVYRARLGVADPDNDLARCKALLDGLRDAGALAKDTYGAIEIGTIQERRGDHGILLIVEEVL
jgi:hypothetical protein